MKIQMGIVGQPNVTVTAFVTAEEEEQIAEINSKREKKRPAERDAFDMTRRRLATQGAEQVRYFAA